MVLAAVFAAIIVLLAACATLLHVPERTRYSTEVVEGRGAYRARRVLVERERPLSWHLALVGSRLTGTLLLCLACAWHRLDDLHSLWLPMAMVGAASWAAGSWMAIDERRARRACLAVAALLALHAVLVAARCAFEWHAFHVAAQRFPMRELSEVALVVHALGFIVAAVSLAQAALLAAAPRPCDRPVRWRESPPVAAHR